MSLFHVSFHGDKGQRRVGGLGQFRSLGRVAWMLISSPSVMAVMSRSLSERLGFISILWGMHEQKLGPKPLT